MKTKEKKNRTENDLHTGELLKAYFAAHRIRKSPLARHLGRRANTVLRYQKNATIQTAILWEISMALKHNFFMDIACKLPSDFTTYAPINDTNEKRIIELEDHIKILTAERDILLKAMKS